MAERSMSKRPPRSPPPQKAPLSPVASKRPRREPPKALDRAIERLEASASELKRERDALAAELAATRDQLAAAMTEIAALDAARRAAIDRIDWVIDSLQTALQEKP